MATIATLAVNMVAKTGAFTKGMKKARKSTNYFSRSLKQLAVQAATVFGAMRAYQFLKGSVALFGEQEKQVRSLSDALALLGKGGVSTMKDMQAFAVQMQKTTIYGDELVLKMMSLGASLSKLSGDKLKQATRSAIGLAAVIKKDLPTAMLLVARAAVGDTSMLTRYGIKISETLSKEEKFQAVLRKGAEGFALATGATKTYAGSMQQLGNRLGDVREYLGGKLVPAILRLSGALKVFNTGIVDNAAKMLKWIVVIETGLFLGPRIVKMFTAIIKTLKLLAKAETVALAFGGPAGWAAIGVGLMVSAAALEVIDNLFKDIKTDSEKAADSINKMIAATNKLAKKQNNGLQSWLEGWVTKALKGFSGKSELDFTKGTANLRDYRFNRAYEESNAAQRAIEAAKQNAEAVEDSAKAYANYTKWIKANTEAMKKNKEAAAQAEHKRLGEFVSGIQKSIKDFGKTEGQLWAEDYAKSSGKGINERLYTVDVLRDLAKLNTMKRMKAGAEEFRNIMKDVTEQLKTFGMDWLAKLKYRVQQLKDITKEQKDKFYDLLDQLKAKKAAAGMAGVLAGGEMRYIERPAFVDIRSSGQDQIQNRQLTELRRGNTLATEGNTALKEIGKQVWK